MAGSLIACLCFVGRAPLAKAAEPTDTQPASQSADAREPRVADFAPGVRINWERRQVELQARVVLREGLLELFACSPQTREHESIVVVRARPLRIFEALGLVGLTPGAPVRFDETSESFWPAYGDPTSIEVRYERDGEPVTADISEWMVQTSDGRTMLPHYWVFAGSRRFEGDRFGADLEGTIICVVDFDTALVALPQSYSSSNDELWLAAKTDAIPPLGTDCTLILKAADVTKLAADVLPGGKLSDGGHEVSAEKLAERFKQQTTGRHGALLMIRVDPKATRADVSTAVGALLRSGVPEVSLQIVPREKPAPQSQPALREGGE
ncbi:MAG TPA: YdjY domain-containing protein [Phycisphaerae bacterium]